MLMMLKEIINKKLERYFLIKTLIAEINAIIFSLNAQKELMTKLDGTKNHFSFFVKSNFNYFSYYDSVITEIGVIDNTELCTAIIKGYIYAKNSFSALNYLTESTINNANEYTKTSKKDLITETASLMTFISKTVIPKTITELSTLKEKLESNLKLFNFKKIKSYYSSLKHNM